MQEGYEQRQPQRPWWTFLLMAIVLIFLIMIFAVVVFAVRRPTVFIPYNGYYWWFFFPFGFILFLFLIFAIVRMVLWGWGPRRRWRYMQDPVYILKQRYARGEITKEQFDQMMKDLAR